MHNFNSIFYLIKSITKQVCFIVVISYLSSLGSVFADGVVVIDNQGEYANINGKIDFIEDQSLKLSLSDIANYSQEWKPLDQSEVSLGFSSSAYWFRLFVKNQLTEKEICFLKIGYALIDYIDFHVVSESGDIKTIRTGDRRPFSTREIEDHHFVFKIENKKEIQAIYIRVQSTNSLRFPFSVLSMTEYLKERSWIMPIYWMYYGLILVLLVIHLYLFIALKERVYIVFSWFLASWALLELTHNGFAFQFFWPNTIIFQDRALPFFVSASIVSLGTFFCYYLETAKQYPRFHKILTYGMIVPGILIGVYSIFGDQIIASKAVLLIAFIMSPLLLILTLYSVIKGNRLAVNLTFGFVGLLIGQLLSNLLHWGYLPLNTITDSSVQIGSAVLLFFFTFGLADRLNIMKKGIEQSELIISQQNIVLEDSNKLLFLNNKEIVKSHEKLKIKEQQLRDILEKLPVPVLLYENKKIVFLNKIFENTFGYTIEDLSEPAKDLEKLLPLKHQLQRVVDDYRQKSNSVSGDGTLQWDSIQIACKDGKLLEVESRITISGSQILIVLNDITEQRKTQELMIQTERMMSIGGLAAGMAHEINNPLAGIIQTASILSNRLSDKTMPANNKAAEAANTTMESVYQFMEDRGILRMLKAVTDSGKRIGSIIENMLNFARKSDFSFSAYDPTVLLEKTVTLASTDLDLKSIIIEKKYDDDLPMVECTESEIQQVLLNVFNNGAHAMFEKQALEKDYRPKFCLKLSKEIEFNMLRIEIKDNGPGIEKETFKRIFEPFFTTKPIGVGTGLGLSVSFFIITENHKGTMEVESELGKGTNFIIRLPLVQE